MKKNIVIAILSMIIIALLYYSNAQKKRANKYLEQANMAQQMAEEAQKEAEELKLQSIRALEYSEREKQKRIEHAERADSGNDRTN